MDEKEVTTVVGSLSCSRYEDVSVRGPSVGSEGGHGGSQRQVQDGPHAGGEEWFGV